MLATASQLQEIIYRTSQKWTPKFIRINNEWGFKAWDYSFAYKQERRCHIKGNCYEKTALDNWKMQGHAASYGLAPDVGNDFMSFPHPTANEWIYGFFTKICPIIISDHPVYDHLGWEFGDSYGDFNCHWKKKNNDDDLNNIDFQYYGLSDLESMLKDIGFEYAEDLHLDNVGFMPNGTFVCIDFDHCHLPPNPITKVDKFISVYQYVGSLG